MYRLCWGPLPASGWSQDAEVSIPPGTHWEEGWLQILAPPWFHFICSEQSYNTQFGYPQEFNQRAVLGGGGFTMLWRSRVVAGGGGAMTHAVMDWTISPAFLRGDNRGLVVLWISYVLPGRSQRMFPHLPLQSTRAGSTAGSHGEHSDLSVLIGKPPRTHDAECSGGAKWLPLHGASSSSPKACYLGKFNSFVPETSDKPVRRGHQSHFIEG